MNVLGEFNTIKGCHINIIDGVRYVGRKKYRWHIPKNLRHLKIKKGDLLIAQSLDKEALVLVYSVFREETKKRYKFILDRVSEGKLKK